MSCFKPCLSVSASVGSQGWAAIWAPASCPERVEAAILVPAARSGLTGAAGLLREIKTVGHAVGRMVARIDRGQSESGLAELHQTHVRMQHFGDVSALGVRAEHQATDT